MLSIWRIDAAARSLQRRRRRYLVGKKAKERRLQKEADHAARRSSLGTSQRLVTSVNRSSRTATAHASDSIAADEMKCILCKEPTTPSEPEEHIVEEGFIGHVEFLIESSGGLVSTDHLTLRNGEVCGRCNNAVAPLGEHLQKQLGVYKVLFNAIGTKSGKSAKFERPGFYMYREGGHVHMVINGEPHSITAPDGHVVQPAKNHPEGIQSTGFEHEGGLARTGFNQPMRFNKKFSRALHKIAFELLCHRLGRNHVLDSRYDPLREYVLRGRGSRAIAMATKAEIGPHVQPKIHLVAVPERDAWICELGLGMTFIVDLSPDNFVAQAADPEMLERAGMRLWWDDQARRTSAA